MVSGLGFRVESRAKVVLLVGPDNDPHPQTRSNPTRKNVRVPRQTLMMLEHVLIPYAALEPSLSIDSFLQRCVLGAL